MRKLCFGNENKSSRDKLCGDLAACLYLRVINLWYDALHYYIISYALFSLLGLGEESGMDFNCGFEGENDS